MGVFVCSVEGPDFTGKTTIANLLVEELRRAFPKKIVKKTVVPSVLITGGFLKILRNSSDNVSPEVFALGYAMDHLHHDRQFLEPLRKSKEDYIVVQERGLLSTLIYQGVIGKVDEDWLDVINRYDKNYPDLQLILKVPLEELVKRRGLENRDFDKFETEKHIKKQTKVYHKLPPALEVKFKPVYIDASGDPTQVAKDCAAAVREAVKK